MRYSVQEPRHPSNDRFILSKGHAAPILYAAWAEAGLFPTSDLLNLRKIDSDLEGHPTPRLNFIDVATGSLGQGLSVAAGMAYCAKHFDKASYRTYCLIGDGESMEGNIWEALNFAGFYKLDNLCAIFDINRLGQSDPAPLQHDMEQYRKRLQSFGFNTVVVDGHDVVELCKAFHTAETTKDMPTAILMKTFKGKDFPEIEDKMNWHGKPLGEKTDAVIEHLATLLKNPGEKAAKKAKKAAEKEGSGGGEEETSETTTPEDSSDKKPEETTTDTAPEDVGVSPEDTTTTSDTTEEEDSVNEEEGGDDPTESDHTEL